ncbi:coiled-coil domain-containing protein 69 [Melospiza georgiana]|uniref:coiled-coil domain-containing protein 69 n=1 Tax=Melospiza georgiana TaxID=44398 RepID=UPI0025AD7161|nr:coiled-coil domain-containing protein 69 [Melospiza georgiana]
MGCTGSALRCCPVGAERQLKAQQQRGSASQELSALKTQNAKACLLPEHGEKAARPEEWAESTRFLRGQEEEEEQQDAGQAGTASISQDIEIQVEKRKEWELKEQLDALRREHTETLQEIQGAHEQEKLLLTESHHRSEAALQEKIQALNSQLKSFQDRMKRMEESLLRTDYRKHIQEHGSPSPFWEQELESLHFVIEMKNEHIHGLDKKLLHLETVEERNLQLEEKVKTLQQENEDLQVRTQNHLVMASSPTSSRRPAGLWRRRRSCWTRLAGRRRSCCTECCTPGTAPPSPWPPARCPSSPRSTGGTGDCGAALRARAALTGAALTGAALTGAALTGAALTGAALTSAPSRGRALGWPSPRGASRTTVMEPFMAVMEHFTAVMEPFTAVMEHFTAVMEHFTAVMEHFTAVMEHFTAVMEHFTAVMEPFTAVMEHFTAVMEHFTAVMEHFTAVMEHFTGHLLLHFPSPCGAAEGPWPPTHAVRAPFALVL